MDNPPPPESSPTTPTPPAAPPPAGSGREDNTVAIVAYLTLIGFIVALIIHSNKKTAIGAYHLRQTLGLILFAIPCFIPVIGWIWALFLFVIWLLSFINAINGKMQPAPLFGSLFEKWFANAFS